MSLNEKVNSIKSSVISNKIIGDDLKPVTVVGKLISKAQELFPDSKDEDFTQLIQETYISLLVDKGIDPIKARQSWVVASGGNFEGYLRNHINQALNKEGIIAVKGNSLKKLGKKSRNIQEIIKFLTLPAKRRCTQTSVGVWPDNDILVLAKTGDSSWRVLSSISAKTSSHSRNTSVLFWSIAVSALGIKYFLATQDRDNQYVKSCISEDVNQERRLFEAYCDRIFTSNPKANYCAQVKSLIIRNDGTSELTDELLDLKRRELPKVTKYNVTSDDLLNRN